MSNSSNTPSANNWLAEMGQPARLLASFAFVATLILASIHSLTATRIADNERQALLTQINTLIPASDYDNDPLNDYIQVAAGELDRADTVLIYRARLRDQPVAALYVTTAPDGYSGSIRLAVAVKADQTLAGVRVLAHRETPGLGDRIEVQKNDWILDFTGKSLHNPPAEQWRVKKDGGVFDQFTGATITPRAIVAASYRVLNWHQQHATELFSSASEIVDGATQ